MLQQVLGADGTNKEGTEVLRLFDTDVEVIKESKKDKRGEEAYAKLRDRLHAKMHAYTRLLSKDVVHALEELVDIDKQENITLNRYVLASWLAKGKDEQNFMINTTIKVLVKETVMHELPLSSAISMIAKRIQSHFVNGLDIRNKSKLEEGEFEFLAAAQLMLIARQLGFYTTFQKSSRFTADRGFTAAYDVVRFTYHVDDNLKKYLKKKLDKEATPFVPRVSHKSSGDYNKYCMEQDPIIWAAIKKLQDVEFKLNPKMVLEHYQLLKATMATVGSDAGKGLSTKLGEIFDRTIDERIENYTFHFKYLCGPDNGRIYGNGFAIPSQQGGRNWMVQFAHSRKANEVGKKHIARKLKSYEGKDMSKAPAKKSLEYYNYVDAQRRIDNDEQLGNFLGLDGMLMGMQSHALLLQDKVQYHYCTAEDGRELMAKRLGLTKDEVKKGMQPYSYGAGKDRVIISIRDISLRNVDAIVYDPDFWSKWEQLFQVYFPATYRLRVFIQALTKQTNLGHRVDYTTWAGFKAVITPLQTLTTVHKTVLGQRSYIRKTVKVNDFGSKLVAAVGHELDSSILVKLILRATYDIKPVHDEYWVHPNDGDKLEEDYLEITKQLLREGPSHLHTMLNEMFAPWVEHFGVLPVHELVAGTLKEEDLVVGIN